MCKAWSSWERPQHEEGASLPSCFERGAPLSAADHRSHRQLGLACEAVGWEMKPEDTTYFCLHRPVSQETITGGQDWRAWPSPPQPIFGKVPCWRGPVVMLSYHSQQQHISLCPFSCWLFLSYNKAWKLSCLAIYSNTYFSQRPTTLHFWGFRNVVLPMQQGKTRGMSPACSRAWLRKRWAPLDHAPELRTSQPCPAQWWAGCRQLPGTVNSPVGSKTLGCTWWHDSSAWHWSTTSAPCSTACSGRAQ